MRKWIRFLRAPQNAAAFFFLTTVVGTGFASGRELWEFFLSQEGYGACGIAFSGVLFVIICRRTIALTKLYGAADLFALVRAIRGPRTAALVNFLLFVFLFGFLALMLTALKTALHAFWPARAFVLTCLLLLFACLASLAGRRAFVRLTACAAPLLLLVIFGSSLYSLLWHLLLAGDVEKLLPTARPPFFACLSAGFLYSFYNAAPLVAALVPFAAELDSPKALRQGCTLGASLFVFLGVLVFSALLLHNPQLAASPLPMLAVSASQICGSLILYAACFLFAGWSSLLCSFFNGCAYLESALACGRVKAALLFLLLGLMTLPLDYGHLVELFAPLFGVSGFLLFLLLFG